MVVYISATLLSVFFASVYRTLKRDRSLPGTNRVLLRKSCAMLSVIPLMLIMAIRRGVGSDYWGYWLTYYGVLRNDVKYSVGRDDIERGFIFLNRVVKVLFDDPQWIFIICALITCTLYFLCIYRESINPAYSILLFVISKEFFISMNAVRQYVAIAILLLAIPYIKRRDGIKTLIVIILAMLMHKSAVIFSAIYFLFLLPPLNPVVVMTITCGGFLFSAGILPIIFPILEKFNFYTKFFANAYNNVNGDIPFEYLLIYMAFFIFLAYEFSKVKHNENLKLLYCAVVINLVILSFTSVMPVNFRRLAFYFNAFIVLYIPEATKALEDKRIRLLMNTAIIILYTAVTLHDTLRGDNDVLPYVTMWSSRISYYKS